MKLEKLESDDLVRLKLLLSEHNRGLVTFEQFERFIVGLINKDEK